MSDADDLSARSRRGELEDSELCQLRHALEGSLEARLAHGAGREFDAEDALRRGDDELAGRIVARVMADRAVGGRRISRRARVFAIAALCAGTAAAAAGSLHFVHERNHEKEGGAGSAQAPAAVPRPQLSLEEKPEPSPEPVASASTAETDSAPMVERRVTPSALPERVPPTSSASALFASANLARRQRCTTEATRLYSELQLQYPDAPESRAADISLGMLTLESGSTASALRHFERYLRGPAADLAPEALWGKSQALLRLGRTADARATWELIVSRHPESAYAKAASANLSAQ